MSKEVEKSALKRILKREAALRTSDKDWYREASKRINELVKSWDSINLEPAPSVVETCQRLSESLQKRFSEVNPSLVLLGGLSTGFWRIKEIYGTLHTSDLDWAMLIDLPKDLDLGVEHNFYSMYCKQINMTNENYLQVYDELWAMAFDATLHTMKSCTDNFPGKKGWGFNLRTIEQARYIVPRLEGIESKIGADMKCKWFTSSFPAEANQMNRKHFFMALKELTEEQQTYIFEKLVKDLSSFFVPKHTHINPGVWFELYNINTFPLEHQKQLRMLENIEELTEGFMNEPVREMLLEMQKEALS